MFYPSFAQTFNIPTQPVFVFDNQPGALKYKIEVWHTGQPIGRYTEEWTPLVGLDYQRKKLLRKLGVNNWQWSVYWYDGAVWNLINLEDGSPPLTEGVFSITGVSLSQYELANKVVVGINEWVDFSWEVAYGDRLVSLQIATDAGFTNIIRERVYEVREGEYTQSCKQYFSTSGLFYWRVKSLQWS